MMKYWLSIHVFLEQKMSEHAALQAVGPGEVRFYGLTGNESMLIP